MSQLFEGRFKFLVELRRRKEMYGDQVVVRKDVRLHDITFMVDGHVFDLSPDLYEIYERSFQAGNL